MELFHWITYPSEYRYLTIVFGCKHNLSLEVLNLLRLYTFTHNHYPSVAEFIDYIAKGCEEGCEFYLPYGDLIDVTRYSLIEFGFIPQCRLAHFMYSFRIFEQRYPNMLEIYNYLQSFSEDTSLSRIASELMERDTIEYWEKKNSGLTEQNIYKYVQTLEEKNEDSVCCVCQEPISPGSLIIRLACSHTFHRGAQYTKEDCVGIEEWLKTSGTCPICRKEVDNPDQGNLASSST